MKVLLITPPMIQLNTPYPATAYLTGYLRSRGWDVAQADPALGWVLRLLAPAGLDRLLATMQARPAATHAPAVRHFIKHFTAIRRQAPVVLRLLQNKDASLSQRIATRRFLVEGPRFNSMGPPGQEEAYLQWAFGTMGTVDRARYFATLFLEDLADAIRLGVDPEFDFSRYGEALAVSQPTLDPLLAALDAAPVTVTVLIELARALVAEHRPDVIGMTLPFPGNVLGALRLARAFKAMAPDCKIVWGGGYVNTELRELSDPRLFTFIDALTYDDGEAPFDALLEHYAGKRAATDLLRTRHLHDGVVTWTSAASMQDVAFKDTGTPTYDGLPLPDYLAMFDMLNPMHRLWSDTRWNKLTVAHGCYWRKCSFCDISLDYIGNYAPLGAALLVDRIEALIEETGGRGFHFVDEAAPPAGLRALATELLRRGVEISFWANIRFEKTFTPELCALLQRAGCIAVSGGLEVASNRLLARMQKGVSVEQVASVTHAFSQAGILVHAYLMYGFPSQTLQETIDSLEMVRQLFEQGCLDSAYWHRFTATAHSPIGKDPSAYGIRLLPMAPVTFARNDLLFADDTGCDHAQLGPGLHKAVYNYMHGMGVDADVRSWFEMPLPRATVPRQFIRHAIAGARGPAPVGAKVARAGAKVTKVVTRTHKT